MVIGIKDVSLTISPMDKLVEAYDYDVEDPHYETSLRVFNPLDTHHNVQTMFILDTGAQLNMLPATYADVISLSLSSATCSISGLISSTTGYLSVAILDFGGDIGPRHVSFCVTSLPHKILSNTLMKKLGVCHCPDVGLRICNS